MEVRQFAVPAACDTPSKIDYHGGSGGGGGGGGGCAPWYGVKMDLLSCRDNDKYDLSNGRKETI